jgi:hypothetical protein
LTLPYRKKIIFFNQNGKKGLTFLSNLDNISTMKKGCINRFADDLDLSYQFIWNCVNGRRNCSAPLADKLAAETKTDIRVWLIGGSIEDRQKAVEKWKEDHDGA